MKNPNNTNKPKKDKSKGPIQGYPKQNLGYQDMSGM